MLPEIELLKGIHPGIVLDRKIKEQKLQKGQLALAVNEYPQTLTSITKGRRSMNTNLSLKLERALGLEEGYFMILQVYYDIKHAKQEEQNRPDLSQFRPVIFWDTNLSSLDWNRQYKAIIRRVMERGNEPEKAALIRFYGKEKVTKVMCE